MPRRPKSAPKSSIFQLKVTLAEVSPPVWRRLLVPSGIPLSKLHAALQVSMGWTNSHLHQFILGRRCFGPPSLDGMDELKLEDEKKVALDSLVGAKQALLYEYDFGDGWTHEALVEKVLEADPRFRYPLCVGGARACPPEDCGGASGYEDLLDALKDPKHEEHDSLVEWVGGVFDAEGFDLNRVNAELRALR
ncbi:plasmid pRiA4b ORF-3 family protein [Myxococcus sp. CA033]|uniref:plasmid pRiA4b ORF-3 family protein n=1 Tax=Myxococcus sp. CA033 TaxID=2741516 RepID=UPI00157B7AB2|nr:plasmid pRiA4b ORF-3 family protein [Myxococcus sp. CA033]NTX41321.1 plasmid pRiA4b ORF-3 family protein [Myxococcus sp. CA033]